MTNFAKQLFDANQKRKDKIALIDESKTLTYGQLEQRAYNFAAFLRSKNLKPQSRIIFYFDDCVEWPLAFLSSLIAGLNPVCLHYNEDQQELTKLIDHVDAEAVIVTTVPNIDTKVQWILKDEILGSTDTLDFTVYDYHDDEPCFWVRTSGTSGHSKAIVHRHKNLSNYVETAKSLFSINDTSVVFATAKLSFAYGLSSCMTMSLPFGATVYLMSGLPNPSKIVDIVNGRNVTHFHSVPTVVNSMLKHSKGQQLPSLKSVLVGGEPFPAVVSKEFYDTFGVLVMNLIGMSESLIYCVQNVNNYEHGTLGRPASNVECKLVDDQGNIVPKGEVGELYLKTDCAASFYWKDWEYTRKTFVGEWIKTGDKLKETELGNYVYVSRTSDQVKINGQFVSAAEIESVLFEISDVYDCAVVFIETEKFPRIHAFVKSVNGKNLNIKELKQMLGKKLPYYKVPDEFHFVESIPKTLTNKTKRHALKQQFLELKP